MVFNMGLTWEWLWLSQVLTTNREMKKQRGLTRKYDDKIDYLQQPWNYPIFILSIMCDGDCLESVVKKIVFPMKRSLK